MKSSQKDDKDKFWIIGFGNSYRRDDGIGPYAAERLKRGLGDDVDVNIVSMHQLGPELAEDLSVAAGIVFVDASHKSLPGGFSWSEVEPVKGFQGIIHSLTPGSLLGLIQLLYNRCPPAWMVSVEGSDFGFGEGLSEVAADGANRATLEITRVIDRCFKSKKAVKSSDDFKTNFAQDFSA